MAITLKKVIHIFKSLTPEHLINILIQNEKEKLLQYNKCISYFIYRYCNTSLLYFKEYNLKRDFSNVYNCK